MTAERYSRSAILLHWGIALALAFQLALGWRLDQIPKGPGLFTAYQLHKSVGIAILLLSLARLVIRFLHPRPPMLADSRWAQFLAKAVHFLLYFVMIAGPLTGWILVSTAKMKIPTLLFGTIPWPHLPVPANWNGFAHGSHGLIGFIGLLLFLLHVVGALRHQFIKREALFPRMLPGSAKYPVLAVIGALTAMFAAHSAGWQWPMPGESPSVSAPSVVRSAASPIVPPSTITAPKAGNAVVPPAISVENAVVPVKADDNAKLADNSGDKADAQKPMPQPLSDWSLSPGGKLGFTATWATMPVNGSFGVWSANVRFSPDALDKSDIRVTVDLGSANTNDSQRDTQLKGGSFFDVIAHPNAIFTSQKVRALGADRYAAEGTLDLHGVTKPVTLNFTLKIDGNIARISGATRLDRTHFGVGSGEYATTDQIGGAVGVNFNFSAKRK